jgi:hypothetical protein
MPLIIAPEYYVRWLEDRDAAEKLFREGGRRERIAEIKIENWGRFYSLYI